MAMFTTHRNRKRKIHCISNEPTPCLYCHYRAHTNICPLIIHLFLPPMIAHYVYNRYLNYTVPLSSVVYHLQPAVYRALQPVCRHLQWTGINHVPKQTHTTSRTIIPTSQHYTMFQMAVEVSHIIGQRWFHDIYVHLQTLFGQWWFTVNTSMTVYPRYLQKHIYINYLGSMARDQDNLASSLNGKLPWWSEELPTGLPRSYI